MEALKRALSKIYTAVVRLDRGTRSRVRLPVPVVSVGNIAVGGRAKTPMVIEICRRLKDEGRVPVVLTRGYGREFRAAVWALGSRDEALELWDPRAQVLLGFKDKNCALSTFTGDEALEIALRAKVDVLVGASRLQNARKYLASHPNAKIVFVLDDGFQHWSLERDLDIVMLRPEDRSDEVLPLGRLRESPEALDRATLVFELGRDVIKRSFFYGSPESFVKPVRVLTTRAPDPDFRSALEEIFKDDFEVHSLRDHAGSKPVLETLSQHPGGTWLVGWKELVKILPWQKLVNPMDLPLSSFDSERGFGVEVIGLKLQFSSSADAELDRELKAVLRGGPK